MILEISLKYFSWMATSKIKKSYKKLIYHNTFGTVDNVTSKFYIKLTSIEHSSPNSSPKANNHLQFTSY